MCCVICNSSLSNILPGIINHTWGAKWSEKEEEKEEERKAANNKTKLNTLNTLVNLGEKENEHWHLYFPILCMLSTESSRGLQIDSSTCLKMRHVHPKINNYVSKLNLAIS